MITINGTNYNLDPNVEAYIVSLQNQMNAMANTTHVIGGPQSVVLPNLIKTAS
jgi:hypothetical protein